MLDLKRRIIAVTSHKGGVGKTTASNVLATGMANAGQRVAWVDLDPQGQDALWFGLPQAAGLANMLVKGQTARSQLVEVPPGLWRVGNASQGTLYLLPGDSANYAVWREIDNPHLLRDKLLELLAGGEVDAIILDTPPAISEDAINYFMAAGRAVVPTKASYLAVQGVVDTMNTIQRIQDLTAGWGETFRAEVEVLGIVPNLYNSGRSLHRANVAALRAQWGELVWPEINDYTAFEEAPQNHEAIWVYLPGDDSADRARARAAKLMRAFQRAVAQADARKEAAHV